MKLNARSRFIEIMGLLFSFHSDFTCSCNLCHTVRSQFTLKDNKPNPYFAAVNGLSSDTMSFSLTWPCSKVLPIWSHLTNTVMCAGCIVSDQRSESTFLDSNWAKGNQDTFKIVTSWHIVGSILDSAALSRKVIAIGNHCPPCHGPNQVRGFNSAPVRLFQWPICSEIKLQTFWGAKRVGVGGGGDNKQQQPMWAEHNACARMSSGL